MQDILQSVAKLKRPKLLSCAAKAADDLSDDQTILTRVFGRPKQSKPKISLLVIMEKEAQMNRLRQSGMSGYSAAAHIDMLAAIRVLFRQSKLHSI
ncbi:MAG: DUF6477 family protein [Planktomarina sp.]